MKRFTLTVLALFLLAGVGHAELRSRVVSASDTSQTVSVNAHSLTIINDGSNEIYIRLFVTGEIPGAAVSGTNEIKSTEGFDFGAPGNGNISAISIICAGGETATVRLKYW